MLRLHACGLTKHSCTSMYKPESGLIALFTHRSFWSQLSSILSCSFSPSQWILPKLMSHLSVHFRKIYSTRTQIHFSAQERHFIPGAILSLRRSPPLLLLRRLRCSLPEWPPRLRPPSTVPHPASGDLSKEEAAVQWQAETQLRHIRSSTEAQATGSFSSSHGMSSTSCLCWAWYVPLSRANSDVGLPMWR